MQALGSPPARTGVRRAESPPGHGQPSTVLHAGEKADGQRHSSPARGMKIAEHTGE